MLIKPLRSWRKHSKKSCRRSSPAICSKTLEEVEFQSRHFSRKRFMPRLSVAVRIAQVLACLLVCKTTLVVLLTFPDYFPPSFRSDFLLGRKAYFFGPYQWAFYTHIVAGPITLLNGLILLNDFVRQRFPTWHRCLGRVQVACVLFLVAPSGLWMAWYAATGTVAAAGFAVLAVVTVVCATKGWRAAMHRRFGEHRRWMLRCYVLLCSAVLLRVIGGLSDVLGVGWTYPYAAWLSWLLPLFVLESLPIIRDRLTSSDR